MARKSWQLSSFIVNLLPSYYHGRSISPQQLVCVETDAQLAWFGYNYTRGRRFCRTRFSRRGLKVIFISRVQLFNLQNTIHGAAVA